jgi:hypothetical protein
VQGALVKRSPPLAELGRLSGSRPLLAIHRNWYPGNLCLPYQGSYPFQERSNRFRCNLAQVIFAPRHPISISISIPRQAGSLLGLFARQWRSREFFNSRCIPNLASNSFKLRRFEPRFLFRSGYSHSCRSLVQVPHFGFTRSHLSFRFRHDTHEMVLSLGAGALPSPPEDGPGC